MRQLIIATGCALALTTLCLGAAETLQAATDAPFSDGPGDDPALGVPQQQAPEQSGMQDQRQQQRMHDQMLLREQLRLQREGHDPAELHRQLQLQQQRQQAEEAVPGEPRRPAQAGPGDTPNQHDRETDIAPEQEVLPDMLPDHEAPPLHDPQQGDPLSDRPQPEPDQPLQ